jgi:Transglutaminase-like superfamily
MRSSPFTQEMGRPTPGLDDLAFSLSREFGSTDLRPACDTLEELACELMTAAFLSPVEQCAACTLLLGSTAMLRPARDFEPAAFMVDRVLERREGHPLALALVYSEVARKAGIPLWPASDGDRFLVAYTGAEALPLVLDPCTSGRRLGLDELPDELRWLCPHEVGFDLVDLLREAFELRGDVAAALRAVELALAVTLPTAEPLRERLERDRARVLARLN